MLPEGYHARVFARGVGSQFREHPVARARHPVPEHRPSFPPTHHDPASPSLHRVPWDGFPDFAGTMGGSDFRPLVPPHFVAFAWRCSAKRPPSAGSLSEKRSDLLGSWGTPMRARPALRPRWVRDLRPLRGHTIRRPILQELGSPPRLFRGSITRPTRSLSTLRSGSYLSTTQDSLPVRGQRLPGGVGYPLGPEEGFTQLI